MRSYLALLALIFSATVGISCAHNKVDYSKNEAATATTGKEGKGLTAQVNWLKYKGDKIDLEVDLKNDSDKAVFIKGGAFKLTYGGQEGSFRKEHSYYELTPGRSDKVVLAFRFASKLPPEGTANLTIDPINEGTIDKVGKAMHPIKLDLPVKKQ